LVRSCFYIPLLNYNPLLGVADYLPSSVVYYIVFFRPILEVDLGSLFYYLGD